MRTYTLTNRRDIFYGDSRDERVYGLAGDDDLFGGSGDDILFGDKGQDLLVGERGDDELHGGAGSDLLAGERGDDSLNGGSGYDYADYFYAESGVVLDLAAGTAADGDGGSDTLRSIEGAYGSRNADTLRGDTGINELFGEAGNDILIGGAGQDLTVGDAGADRFVFDDGDVADRLGDADLVGDFTRSEGDKIDLAGIDADANAAGDQAFAFIGTGAFSGVAGQLRVETMSGERVLSGDLDGDAAADFFIRVDSNQQLIASDLML